MVNLLIQALRLADLRHGVFGKALAAEPGEKIARPKPVEQRVLIHHAVGRRAQQFEHRGIIFQQQFDKAAQLVKHLIVGFISYLRHVIEAKKCCFRQGEYAFEVGIGVR